MSIRFWTKQGIFRYGTWRQLAHHRGQCGAIFTEQLSEKATQKHPKWRNRTSCMVDCCGSADKSSSSLDIILILIVNANIHVWLWSIQLYSQQTRMFWLFSRYDITDINKSSGVHFQMLLLQFDYFFYLPQYSNGFDFNSIQTTSSLL